MFGFLGFLLILFLLIVIIGFSILGNVLRLIFGFGRRNGNTQSRTYTNQRQQTYNETNDTSSNESNRSHSSSKAESNVTGNKKKIFDNDEGEYVDYEEVKDK